MHTVVISGAARTPMGGFQGDLNGVPAAELGGAAICAAMEGAGVSTVDEVLMGNVYLQAKAKRPHDKPDLPQGSVMMSPRRR